MKNIFKILTIGVILLSVYGLVSCATIIRGTKSKITFSSQNGEVLNITITDKKGEVFSGQTPATVTLKKQTGVFDPAQYNVEASVVGTSESVTIRLQTAEDAGDLAWGALILGNIWLYGVVGIWVDLLDGAFYKWSAPRVTDGDGGFSGQVEKKKGELLIYVND